ncbi:hypothetical protein EV143_106145 [Flavobacterium chryseum]|uniref:hypothetical protein n=1 Tax=Flavobacterium sp. P3160 TaxID=2512113 RepID=UPI0010E14A5B|nr:hypothetical protein [Flavobacterium sp. P3160]TDO73203.1 hypothetical protein EV143_106145 [Flavobacterium sp. P3160]
MKKIIVFFTILVPYLAFSETVQKPIAVPINEFTNILLVAGIIFGAYVINKKK